MMGDCCARRSSGGTLKVAAKMGAVMLRMGVANGYPYVWAIPSSDSRYGWVIVRRVVAVSAITSIPDPFQIASYASIHDAFSGYMAADPNTFPMMATTIDGTALVLQLHEA